MARRRRRRHYGGLVSIPAVGRLDMKSLNPTGKTVRSDDVLMGAFGGLAGGLGVKYALSKAGILPKLPAFLLRNITATTTIAAGVLALMFRKNKSAGLGNFVGAIAAGLTPVVGGVLVKTFPSFAGLVMVPQVGGYGRYGGLLIDDAYAGLLIDDNAAMNGMSAFERMSMGAEGDPDQLSPA
jgi:hypothetical protein